MSIDAVTYERYLAACDKVRTLGLSLPEVLDHDALLLTPKRELAIQVQVLEDLYRRLERQSAAKLMAYSFGRNEGTAAEMFMALLEWLELVVTAMANGKLEDL